MRGLRPRAPGIYRLLPECRGGGLLSRPRIPAPGRRSGRIPAEPYPPPGAVSIVEVPEYLLTFSLPPTAAVGYNNLVLACLVGRF